MKASKITNIISVGLLTLVMIYLSFSNLFKWISSVLTTNYFHLPHLTYTLISFAIAIILIIYSVFLTRSKIDYKGWVKASMVLNLLGAISFVLFLGWGAINYLECMVTHGNKCLLGLQLNTLIGLIGAGFCFVIGFILLIIGIVRNKKGN